METWCVLESGPQPPPENMAWDEALLENAQARKHPVLRWYGWTEPAATFGYFQKHAEIARTTQLRPLVRRPTGGGLVPHDADWTYSLCFPPGHPWHELRAQESYHRTHDWLRRGFEGLGIPTELATAARHDLPGQCFAGYEQSDVLWQGRKVAGAAQRRNHLGLLIQGSIQPPPLGLERSAFALALQQAATRDWGVTWLPWQPDDPTRQRAAELAALKYCRADHNQKR
jgi:lipoate-protein ligase A